MFRKSLIYMLLYVSVLSAQEAPINAYYEGRSPKKALVLSLVLPGVGQAYSGRYVPALAYAGLEAGLIAYALHMKVRGDQGVLDYQAYADEHWDIHRWFEGDPAMDNPGYYANLATNPKTHNVYIRAEGHRLTFFEFLDTYPAVDDLPDHEDYSIIEEYHFYENIGKYKQFKQGWDDYSSTSGFETDTRFSPNQEHYAYMRMEANDYLKAAGYAGTALMFNHLVSAVDAYIRASGSRNRIHAGAVPMPELGNPGAVMMFSIEL